MELRIDGIAIRNASVNSVDFGTRTVKQSELTGGLVKEMVGKTVPSFSTKTAKFVLIIHGTRRDEIRAVASDVVLKAGGGLHLFSFDALSHSFRGVLKSYQTTETVPDRMTKLVLTVEGQEVGRKRTYAWSEGKDLSEILISNPGTFWSPCLIDFGVENVHPEMSTVNFLRDPWTMKKVGIYYDSKSYYVERGFDVFIDSESGLTALRDPIERVVYNSDDDETVYYTPWDEDEYYLEHQTEVDAAVASSRDSVSPVSSLTYTELFQINGLMYLAPGANSFSSQDAENMFVRVYRLEFYDTYL